MFFCFVVVVVVVVVVVYSVIPAGFVICFFLFQRCVFMVCVLYMRLLNITLQLLHNSNQIHEKIFLKNHSGETNII